MTSYSQINRTSDMDERLTGNPQITFFKGVYRRHTNFSKGLHVYTKKEELHNGDNIAPKIEEISYGSFDLITDIFIEHKITGLASSEKIYANLGNTIIDKIVFRVGQTDLYTLKGLYMEARAELEHPYEPSSLNNFSVPPIMNKKGTEDILTCNTGSQYNITTMAGGVSGSTIGDADATYDTDTFYTYPNFYFSKSYGNAFPILALNHTNIELDVKYNNWSKFTDSTAATAAKLESNVNVEYINLSNEERYRFINNEEPYIYYDIMEMNGPGKLEIYYPIRQIFFIGTQTNSTPILSVNTPYSLIDAKITDINIQLNRKDIYDTVSNKMDIYTKHNIYRCYPGYGRELDITAAKSHGYNDSIGIYSPSLDPMDSSQPNGHISVSTHIDVTYTSMDSSNNIRIFIEYIKFFHIMSGQLSLLYV
jgi:hypothetical protein